MGISSPTCSGYTKTQSFDWMLGMGNLNRAKVVDVAKWSLVDGGDLGR
jgi:hypothetical protein